MTIRTLLIPFVLCSLVLAGCPGEIHYCDPGATQECLCVGGAVGAQVCETEGSGWDPCDCGGGGDDDDTVGDDDDDDTVGDDDDTTPPPDPISELDWWLHNDYESLVYVTWDQSQAGTAHVEFSFDEGEWHSTPAFEAEAGSNETLIVGIPYEMDAEWKVVVDGLDPAEGPTITTDDVPNGLPLGTVEIEDPDNWLVEGVYLLTSINEDNGGWTGGDYWTFIVDRQARPVWASKAPMHHWTLYAQVALTGDHILWDEATYWSSWDSGAGSTVHRTYLDVEIEEIATPGLHHAFIQMPPDGDVLVWGSQYHGGHEALVKQGSGDVTQTIIWTCQGDWPGSGNCESNGIFYQESTDSFLYSFYTNNAVVEVDHQTGESLWWAGGVGGGYSFDPPSSQFSWQHGVSYTDTGTFLLSTEANIGGPTTPVREYNVDHDNQVLHQEWYYDPQTYASTNGDAWRLDNGNTLHVLGAASEIYEVTMDGVEVWRVNYHGSRLLGRGEYIEDLYTLVSP